MKTNFAIADLAVMELTPRGSVLTVLSENDPLLRRFGQVDVVALDGSAPQTILRKKADEVWTVLEGEAHFSLVDHREDSPSFQQKVTVVLKAQSPQVLLIPFGVLGQVMSDTQTRCLRLTTHADTTHPDDQIPA